MKPRFALALAFVALAAYRIAVFGWLLTLYQGWFLPASWGLPVLSWKQGMELVFGVTLIESMVRQRPDHEPDGQDAMFELLAPVVALAVGVVGHLLLTFT